MIVTDLGMPQVDGFQLDRSDQAIAIRGPPRTCRGADGLCPIGRSREGAARGLSDPSRQADRPCGAGDDSRRTRPAVQVRRHDEQSLGRHSGFDLRVHATGDLHIDTHHTVEDVAIAIGEAFREALGDKAGIRRFASGRYPLDEALIDVALDLSGRAHVEWLVPMPESLPLGTPAFDPQLAEHAVSSFANAAAMTLHVELVRGRNVHHIIEATFKGLARVVERRRASRPRRRCPVDQRRAVRSCRERRSAL